MSDTPVKVASAARHSVAYVLETTAGVTPPTPTMKALRYTTCALGLSRDTLTSQERRPDRQISDVRTGTDKINGSIGFELSLEAFDDLLEACLAGTWAGDILSVGTEQRSMTIERSFPDIGEYITYRGCFANKMSLSVKPNAIVTGSFEIVGFSGDVATAPLAADVAAAPTHKVFDSYTGELKEGGDVIGVVTGIDLSLDNGIAAQYCVFQRSASFADWGKATVTGTLTAFFESGGLLRKFLSETPTGLEFTVGDDNGGYTVICPSIRYTGAELPVQSDGPITLSLPFAAKFDPATGTNLRIVRHGAAPALPAAPTLISSVPADDAVDVPVGSAITLTFSKPVQAGSGSITISNGADDVRVIPVTDASVAIAGAVVTITPVAALKAADVYHILVPGTAIRSTDGAAFAGITDPATLNFATA